ncbi:MAG: hypothetical protein HRU77_09780 [Gammaproteobacteria bacterium]|nr:MAG: hypothetical protein HRU77_09780 [Gammaproteobacteria bacterium]
MSQLKQSNFERHRTHINETLKHFQTVRASGLGIKFVSGKPTEEPCLSVFVSKKIEHDLLTKEEMLPKAIRIGQHLHPIDVVEMGSFIRQSAPENYPFGVCLTDEKENGTRSAFATTANGIMALTCSHVIAGKDNNPMTPALIKSFDWTSKKWESFGQSDQAVFGPGNRNPLDFGYLDAALVKLLPGIEPNPISNTPLPCFVPRSIKDIESLAGKIVAGFGIASGKCLGMVQAVLVSGVGGGHLSADIIVGALSSDGLTRKGDSGMLWFDQQGQVIAQHVLGELSAPGKGSKLTIATLINRINSRLQIFSLR